MGQTCGRLNELRGGAAAHPHHLRDNFVHELVGSPLLHYTVVRSLGEGHSSSVMLVRHNSTGELFAMKVISDATMSLGARNLDELRNEINIMRSITHPLIVRVYEFYFSPPARLSIIMEACHGGELYRYLNDLPRGHCIEEEAARFSYQIASAVAYLHEEGVVHRDLKLENFVFRHAGRYDELTLIDFGFSHRFSTGSSSRMTTIVGTPYYIAPEILSSSASKGYDEKVDAWSLGVITYMLISGMPPFRGRRDADVIAAVKRGRVSYGSAFIHVSESCKDFISRLLLHNPAGRMSVRDALVHPFLLPHVRVQNQRVPREVISELRRFHHLRGWKRVALEAVAFSRHGDDEYHSLRSAFRLFDTENSGHLKLESFSAVLRAEGVAPEEATELFRSVALGADSVSYNEFLAATLPRRLITPLLLKRAFDALDIDAVGFLTIASLVRALGDESKGFDEDEIRAELFSESNRCTFDVFSRQFWVRKAGEDAETGEV